MDLRRRRFAAAAWLLAGLLFVAACGSDNSPSGGSSGSGKQTVKFTVFPGAMVSMGVYVADAHSFFAKQGLKVEYVNVGTGSSALQVLAAGQTDFAISDVTGTATARAAGSDIVFASGQFTRFSGALQCQNHLATTSTTYPDSLKGLAGKKVGITAPGSATDTYLRYSLIEAGVDPSQVQIIPIGGIPQLLAAMKSRHVDCVTAYQPMQQQLTDVKTLVDWQAGQGPDAFKGYLFNGIATSGKFAQANPETVKKVNAAMREASAYANDPANAATITQETLKFFQGIDQATLQKVVTDLAGTYGADLTPTQVQNAATVFHAVNGKPLNATYGQLVAAPVRQSS